MSKKNLSAGACWIFVICQLITTFTFSAIEDKQGSEIVRADRNAAVLLITADSLADAWKPLAQWKTRQGKWTEIVTISQIEKQYEGDDVQQKIRACCLDYIENKGTQWVILGGDSQPGGKGLVPDRDTYHQDPLPNQKDIPTDIYYISEKDWDANGDGIYGDWANDKEAVAYTNGRVSIGRIPVRTKADVAAYTEKIVAYESNYPTSDFASQLIYTCPENSAYPKLGTSRKVLQECWDGGTCRQFFATHTPWDKDTAGDYDLSPDHWVKMINDKAAGKLHMHGHGFLPVWVLEKHQTVTAGHVDKLTNENAYLTMTTVSCFTGHYDAEADPAITEMMLRKPKGGAVLVIAPSRPGVPVFHSPQEMRLMITEGKMDATTQTMTRFWKHALTGSLSAGEAFQKAKNDMIEDAKKSAGFHFIQCELNLLGDPTLDLRAKDPVKPKLEIPKTISTGRQTVKVCSDVPDATVCLWKEGEVYKVLKTSDEGEAAVQIDCKTKGKLQVTICGPGLNTSLGEIQVM